MATFILLFSVGTNFKTPKIHRTVRASDLSYQSHGDYQADYLTVEHNTVVDLRQEFILLGRETHTGKVRTLASASTPLVGRREAQLSHRDRATPLYVSWNLFNC